MNPLHYSIAAILLFGVGSAVAQKADREKELFAELPMVEAVSLHAQTLAEAPANVTVLTAAEIHRYGYRTLADALASVEGFYVTYDHEYHYVGVSGISLPGDYNTRFLVMLNGHALTDNIYNSNGFFGQDFGLDMDLVDRIEIIRGPTSALYGSNGILANINIVTKSPVDAERLRSSVEVGTAGERKIAFSSSVNLGRGANLLVAGAFFHNDSQFGTADGERGFHSFAQLVWRSWSFTGYFNSRDKQVPVGVGTSLADDPGQRAIDKRNFLSAVYRHSAGPGEMQWQTAYDQYRYQDRYDYAGTDIVPGERTFCFNRGDWLNSQFTYSLPVHNIGPLTVGLAGTWDLRAEQFDQQSERIFDYSNEPDRGLAVFAQQEWKISSRWQVYAGVRLDYTRHYGRALSPRVAAVYQHSARIVYKVVYGRPFRNPSAFEQFYSNGGLSNVAPARLRPETADAMEFSAERRTGKNWTVIGRVYQYRLLHLIDALATDDGALRYRNASRGLSNGMGFSLRGRVRDLEVSASSAWGRAQGGEDQLRLANSPAVVSKLRLGLPLHAGVLFLAGNVQYISARQSWTGGRLGGAAVAGATLTARLNQRFDLQGGVSNVLNKRYEDPIYLAVDRLRGDGREFFVRLVCHAWE